VNIELYIQSGIVESYALGLATPGEREEFEQLLPHYPELGLALSEFEYQLELFAIEHEVAPPPGTREQIEARVRETPAVRHRGWRKRTGADARKGMLKTWLVIVFILAIIFLALAIYFYVGYRHARSELHRVQDQMSGTRQL
jgi:anti-sigma-K factor RskA